MPYKFSNSIIVILTLIFGIVITINSLKAADVVTDDDKMELFDLISDPLESMNRVTSGFLRAIELDCQKRSWQETVWRSSCDPTDC